MALTGTHSYFGQQVAGSVATIFAPHLQSLGAAQAVLLAPGSRIEADAIVLSGSPAAAGTRGEAGGDGVAVGRTVADVERDLIIDTLRHCFGNRTHAATILGISIRTLRNKLRQYLDEGVAIPPPGERRELEQAAL